MIRIDTFWLALGASDLRGGIDRLLAMVVHGFALGPDAHHVGSGVFERVHTIDNDLGISGAAAQKAPRRFVWNRG